MKKIAAGTVAGYGVVSESDLHLDVFGNTQPGSKPIVWESPLYLSPFQARNHASKLGAYGRRLIVKLVVVEEVE